MQITTDNHILIDGKETGFYVHQHPHKTTLSTYTHGRYKEYPLQHRRYNLNTDDYCNPGVATRTTFEKEIRELCEKHPKPKTYSYRQTR